VLLHEVSQPSGVSGCSHAGGTDRHVTQISRGWFTQYGDTAAAALDHDESRSGEPFYQASEDWMPGRDVKPDERVDEGTKSVQIDLVLVRFHRPDAGRRTGGRHECFGGAGEELSHTVGRVPQDLIPNLEVPTHSASIGDLGALATRAPRCISCVSSTSVPSP
jgi:hypothetical protein